ncbi:hypothetical protein CAPTEDRAFT_114226 [Capitella teleta]|uniref:Globin domain-containing protein n=1 Tax=Capitella teleta TaxID=283909 RepID=R7UNQ2_CAPTE|nr:hypothetical protein CAPTEDRAFT_114226 [Capitella teleta]|eukprot:ELU07733.1 hypothetical protein CAPTEDRAFT_114226 [Capitella teleta]
MPSAAEIASIQAHWNANVSANKQAVGNLLFQQYFAKYPADQAKFKKFADVAAGDLGGNAAFNAQTLNTLSFLEKVVQACGNGGVEMMAAQMPAHRGWGVDQSYFKKMFDFLPGFMGENGADAACVAAWKVAGAELTAACK